MDPATAAASDPVGSRHGGEAAQAAVKLQAPRLLLLLLLPLCGLLLLLWRHLHLYPLALLALHRSSWGLLHKLLLWWWWCLWSLRLHQQLRAAEPPLLPVDELRCSSDVGSN